MSNAHVLVLIAAIVVVLILFFGLRMTVLRRQRRHR
jgi:hypothetical protein